MASITFSPDKLLPECLCGGEGLSRGYVFQVTALSNDACIPLKSLIGQPARVDLLTSAGGAERPFHGYITAAELTEPNGGVIAAKKHVWFGRKPVGVRQRTQMGET